MTETQQTLTGEPTDEPRQRPSTIVTCPECDAVLLRSERHDHPHDVFPWVGFTQIPDGIPDDDPEDPEDPADEPMQVGNWYDITLSYNVDYRFTVPGHDRHDAESIAKALTWDCSPSDRFHVHTDSRELNEIYEDDAEAVAELDELERGV